MVLGNALHHLTAVVDPRPCHVLGFELLFFLPCSALCRLHNAYLTPNVALSRDPWETTTRFRGLPGERCAKWPERGSGNCEHKGTSLFAPVPEIPARPQSLTCRTLNREESPNFWELGPKTCIGKREGPSRVRSAPRCYRRYRSSTL